MSLVERLSIAFLALFLVFFFVPQVGEASHRSNEERIDNYIEWFKQQSSTIKKRVSRLDDDPVKKFEIPVLFGVALEDITENFGEPRGGGTRLHEGLDMLAPIGVPIVTPTDAVVLRTGEWSSAGKFVYTANPGDEVFVYMHLDEIADIDPGDVLKPGDLIGFNGDTGNANGTAHLHFEVRDEDGDATDPYPRVQREYDLEEKIEILDEILDDIRKDDELAELLVDLYGGTFLRAQNSDIDLPREIEDALEDAGLDISLDGISRTLKNGSENSDVVKLQNFLTAMDSGSAARTLARAGATGYFGSITEAALREYQEAMGEQVTGVYTPGTTNAPSKEPSSNTGSSLSVIATLLPSDLTIGDSGPMVTLIQLYLIIQQSGPAATELFKASATGYYGPITARAMSEYQTKNNIPATGIYDMRTRALIADS